MLLRRNAARATAVAVAFALLALARLPELPEAERAALAARYAFTRLPLHEVDGVRYQQRRVVNPAFERHVQWTSGLGAAVALADLDGDGLPNDVCHVDPRTDLVTIAPAPGTADRYAIFVLDAAPLPYDRATMAPTGCVPADLDEDGRSDLLVYYWGRTPVLFFQRTPADGGGFSRTRFVPRELVATGERWYTMAATFADLDGDGHVDLVVGNYFADGARVLDANAPVADSMHHSWSRAYNGGRDRVFLLDRRRRRSDVTGRSKGYLDERLARQWTLGLGAADLDGDLLPELYVANDFGPDRLLHNRSDARAPRLRRSSRAAEDPHRARVERARPRLLQGHGRRLRRPQRRRLSRHVRQQHRRGIRRSLESHFVWVSTGGRGRCLRTASLPTCDRARTSACRAAAGDGTRDSATSTTTACSRRSRRPASSKAKINRWPELQVLATANDQLVAPALLAAVSDRATTSADTTTIGSACAAADGRYYDIAAGRRPGTHRT